MRDSGADGGARTEPLGVLLVGCREHTRKENRAIRDQLSTTWLAFQGMFLRVCSRFQSGTSNFGGYRMLFQVWWKCEGDGSSGSSSREL